MPDLILPDNVQILLKALLVVGTGTWITILIGTFKIIRYMSIMTFKLDILWNQYERNTNIDTPDYQGPGRRSKKT